MKTEKWIMAHDGGAKGNYITPLSGPNHGLGGFDAREREIASASGGTVTAALLKRPGKHVPTEKPWVQTPADFCKPMPYSNSPDPMNYPKGRKAKSKIAKTMHEWGQGTLHSGSKKGPVVKSQKQAVAIALSQARKT